MKPFIGATVQYQPSKVISEPLRAQPLHGVICHVLNDTMVNIAYWDENGEARNARGVALVIDEAAGDQCGDFAVLA